MNSASIGAGPTSRMRPVFCVKRVEKASITALTTAGGEPMAPASPQPFTPSGLWVQGVTLP